MSKWTIAKETVATLSEQAPEHGADAAGMLNFPSKHSSDCPKNE